MKILDRENNENFSIKNNNLYFKSRLLTNIDKEKNTFYWQADSIKSYKTGVLYTKTYGYEKVQQITFWGNDGKPLFSFNSDHLPYDTNLNKSKADNINTLVFDKGVLVSQKNSDNQEKFIFYFYDKTYLTSYDFEKLKEKVKILTEPQTHTEFILNHLEK